MRRLSIKARVTLWYTGLLLLLLVLGTAYLLAFSDQITSRQLRDSLQESVSEAVKNAQFDHGELEDEDIDFYRNGVSVFLYDTSGRLLAPRVSDSIWAERLFSCSSSSCWDDDWRSRSATTLSQWAASPSAFRMASSHSRSWLWAVSIS